MSEINIVKSTQELAQLVKSNPSLIERSEMQIGQDLLSIYQDPNFSDSFKDLKKLKSEILKAVIEDVSLGGPRLKTSSFGVTFRTGKLEIFTVDLSDSPSGNVVYSISLKNRAAFKNWRNKDDDELSQEAIHSTIYLLAVAWSQLL